MTKTKETLLQLYAEKKAEVKKISDELEALEPKVLTLLEKQGVDTLRQDYGTFSVVYRKKWTYSDELLQKEKEYSTIIKTKKEDEQTSGEAKAEEIKGLSYREYNEKGD